MSKYGYGAFIERELFESKAFKSLTKKQMQIYFYFLLKRQFGQNKGKSGKPGKRTPSKIIINNGKIVFTYSEAEKLGFPRKTFRVAIDKLIEVGFIDIAHPGKGGMVVNGKVTGECTLYGIFERWKDYGNENFETKKRQKDTRQGRGWAVYHRNKQHQNLQEQMRRSFKKKAEKNKSK